MVLTMTENERKKVLLIFPYLSEDHGRIYHVLGL